VHNATQGGRFCEPEPAFLGNERDALRQLDVAAGSSSDKRGAGSKSSGRRNPDSAPASADRLTGFAM
jgi:hypothetical protein